MIEAFEDYVNWWPTWYACIDLYVLFVCGYAAVWGWTDGGLFGGRFYRDRMIRGAIGLVLCVAMLWPVVLATYLVLNLPSWLRNESEYEQAQRYERRWSRSLSTER